MAALPHLSCLDKVALADDLGQAIPFVLDQRLDFLRHEMTSSLLSSLNGLMQATGGRGHLNLLLGAGFRRTMALYEGFSDAARHRNAQSALVLLRAQLDTLMRFHGMWLVEDREAYFEALLSGVVRAQKSRGGERLTDAILHRELSTRYEGLSEDYKLLSGLAHLSTFAIVAPHDCNEQGEIGLRLDHNDWPSAAVCGSIVAFGLYGGALAHMYSILELAAKGNVLDDMFDPEIDPFAEVPLPGWINTIRCGRQYL